MKLHKWIADGNDIKDLHEVPFTQEKCNGIFYYSNHQMYALFQYKDDAYKWGGSTPEDWLSVKEKYKALSSWALLPSSDEGFFINFDENKGSVEHLLKDDDVLLLNQNL